MLEKKDNNSIIERNDMKHLKILPKLDHETFMVKDSIGILDLFKCKECPYMALNIKDLKFHWHTLHVSTESDNKKRPVIVVTVKCPGCCGFFHTEMSLKTHFKSHHKMCAKDSHKLALSLIEEFEKNQKYIANLEVVIEGHKYSSKDLPPLIEIPPDPIQHQNLTILPGNMLNKNLAMIKQNRQETNCNIKQCYFDAGATNRQEVCPSNILEREPLAAVIANKGIQINALATMSSLQNGSKSHQSEKDTQIDGSLKIVEDSTRKDALDKVVLRKLGRPFASKSLGITHYKKTHPEEVLNQEFGSKCNVQGCGLRMFSKEKLEYHRSCHDTHSKEFLCVECKNTFATVKLMHSHLWSQHNVDLELFSCDKCPVKVFSVKQVNSHKKIHSEEKLFACEICCKVFKNNKLLGKHRKRHNKDQVKKFKCEICGREVSSQTQLKRHKEAVHEKIKRFRCEHCQYTSSMKSSLLLHLRLHTKEKPLHCQLCPFKTGDRTTLRRHLQKHSQEKGYQCNHCSYTCVQASSLKTHVKSKHSTLQSDLIHTCTQCPYTTINKNNFTAHVSSHTNYHKPISDREETPKLQIDRVCDENHASDMQQEIPSVYENSSVTSIQYNSVENTNVCFQNPGHSVNDFDIVRNNNAINSEQIVMKNYFNLDLHKNFNCASTVGDEYRQQFVEKAAHSKQLLVNNDYEDSRQVNNLNESTYSSPGLSIDESVVGSESASNVDLPNQVLDLNTTQNMKSSEVSKINNIFVKDILDLAASSIRSVNLETLLPQNSMNAEVSFETNSHPIILVNPNTQKSTSNTDADSFPNFGNYFSTTPQSGAPQILQIPLSTQSTIIDGVPRKKPKISVKSNLILKGPNSLNIFNQQKFKTLNNNFNLNDQPFMVNSNLSLPFDSSVDSVSHTTCSTLNMKPISELTSGEPFAPENSYLPNYLLNSDYSFPNLQILGQNDMCVNQTLVNGPIADMSEIKLENKPFIPIQSELSCMSSNEINSVNVPLMYEIPKDTIPMQMPIKYEQKSDMLGSYIYQDNLFSNALTHMDNVSIIEELPASFENSEYNMPSYPYEDNSYFDNDIPTDNLDECEIIVVDDASCDIKSLPSLGCEPSFGNLIRAPLMDNPISRDVPPPLRVNTNVNDQKHVKEKPRIISEVHISSDKSKIMNFAAVKNLGFKLEFPSMKNIDWTLALLNDQQNKLL